MNLEGRKVLVNKSSSELVAMLNAPKDYEQLMPEGLQKFETTENGFKFALKGMPEIALKIDEATAERVVLKSGNPNLDFALIGKMNSINDNQTEVQLLFEGKFNAFIKMMVEKPLQNFINTLTDKIEQL
ncbi:MAG: SRPBCC family protein [Bergeyella zoohelcum]|nr:SRPBCC family protein [Bergeyella zoohelcum]